MNTSMMLSSCGGVIPISSNERWNPIRGGYDGKLGSSSMGLMALSSSISTSMSWLNFFLLDSVRVPPPISIFVSLLLLYSSSSCFLLSGSSCFLFSSYSFYLFSRLASIEIFLNGSISTLCYSLLLDPALSFSWELLCFPGKLFLVVPLASMHLAFVELYKCLPHILSESFIMCCTSSLPFYPLQFSLVHIPNHILSCHNVVYTPS